MSEPAPEPPAAPAEKSSGRRRSEQDERVGWLRRNRFKLALGIALAEGVVVALEKDFSRWTVILIAIPVVLFYLLAGRTLESDFGREVSWILAMSQALAVVAAVIALFIPTAALIIAGAFGAVAIYLLLHDRPDQRRPAD